MKRKVLSVLLASAMVASLAACGSSNDAPAQSAAATDSAAASTEASTEAYNLEEINVVVNGTLQPLITARLNSFSSGMMQYPKQSVILLR